jgi:hypothetical protein
MASSLADKTHEELMDIRLGTPLKQKDVKKLSMGYHVEIHRLSSDSSLLHGLRAAYSRGYITAPRNPQLAGMHALSRF